VYSVCVTQLLSSPCIALLSRDPSTGCI